MTGWICAPPTWLIATEAAKLSPQKVPDTGVHAGEREVSVSILEGPRVSGAIAAVISRLSPHAGIRAANDVDSGVTTAEASPSILAGVDDLIDVALGTQRIGSRVPHYANTACCSDSDSIERGFSGAHLVRDILERIQQNWRDAGRQQRSEENWRFEGQKDGKVTNLTTTGSRANWNTALLTLRSNRAPTGSRPSSSHTARSAVVSRSSQQTPVSTVPVCFITRFVVAGSGAQGHGSPGWWTFGPLQSPMA